MRKATLSKNRTRDLEISSRQTLNIVFETSNLKKDEIVLS